MTTTAIFALTTRQKVKDYVGINDTNSDAVIDEMINSVSEFIRGFCGGRDFLSQQYIETYDTRKNHRKLFLKQYPATVVSTVEYRSGIPTAVVWVTYDPNSYLSYLKEGYVYFYGFLPEIHQGIRITYTAGYLIDFTNEFDTTKHTLPFDLTLAATSIIGLEINTRKAKGISLEMTEGQKIQYLRVVDDEVKNILSRYKNNHFAV